MDTLPFDYRAVFRAFRNRGVQFLLVGGLNYFLAHKPVATQDIDLLVEDRPENLARTEMALIDIQAEWGRNDEDWGPVREKKAGWLSYQGVYCLLTRFGPVDIFRTIPGIASFEFARRNSVEFQFGDDESVCLISADDLLNCQLAIPEQSRRHERVQFLRSLLGK